MTNMSQVSTASLLKAFFKMQFIEKSRKNSHIKIVHISDASRYASLPNHRGQNISLGTFRNILKSTRVSIEELRKVL